MLTETRLALAYRFKEFEAQKAKERMQDTQFKEIDNTASKLVYTPQLDNATPEHTEKGRALEAIAKRAGVSHMTAFQYDKIQQQGTRNDLVDSDINIAQPLGRSKTSECKNRGRGTLGEIAKKTEVAEGKAVE